jgi:hypothetical protein
MSEKEKSFAGSETLLVVSPKVKTEMCFHYRGSDDLINLIMFIGVRPFLNIDLSLQFKKMIVKADSFVFRNELGQVTKVLSSSEMEQKYEIRLASPYDVKWNNKLILKVPDKKK